MPGSSRIGALFEADRTLAALEVPQDQPIDVFAAIKRMGLDLVFADLDHLLGAILPHGNGGVLITTQRGTAIQRYTAAHEIGHWVLHRDQLNLDSEAEVLGTPASERERQAQLFAAYFLMPPPLVTKAVRRYGLRRSEVSPAQVYLVSRYLNVSFEATARRLHTHKLLTAAEVASLVQVGRLAALRQAFDGRRPSDGSADLWDPDDPFETDAQETRHLEVEERDEIVITLPENRTTGWQWLTQTDLAALAGTRQHARPEPPSTTAARQTDPPPSVDPHHVKRAHTQVRTQAEVRAALALTPTLAPVVPPGSSASAKPQIAMAPEGPLEVVGNDFHLAGEPTTARSRGTLRRAIAAGALDSTNADPPRVGATGLRTVVLRCTETGSATFRLEYAHGFDPTAGPAAVYELSVDVRATPVHLYRSQVLAANIDLRMDGDPADDAVFEVIAS